MLPRRFIAKFNEKCYYKPMKIIHCADLHLGSKMDARLPLDKAEERRRELRAAFTDTVEYALSHRVSAIILAGDVFDSDRPLKKDKEFFYSVVKNNPQITFLYLRGNHDCLQSYTQYPENLLTFSDGWRGYRFGNVVISGVEITAANCGAIYSSLSLDPKDINIVTLHGQVGNTDGLARVNLARLAGKNIDYLALGHIHTCSAEKIDGRGNYCYPGCLAGRGFDEAGEKGFILLDITDKISAEFICLPKREVRVTSADISAAEDGYAAYLIAKRAAGNCRKSDVVRVVLTGEADFDNSDLARETEERLQSEGFYYIEVKDETVRKFNAADYEGDASLAGEFVRLVLADGTLDERAKRDIISVGLKALERKEIEI